MNMSVNKTVSEEHLYNAIKDVLKTSGQLSKIKSQLRSNVKNVLQKRRLLASDAELIPPPPKNDVLLINQLIREYLEWNGYLFTSSVMMSEADMPASKTAREDLCAVLGVRDDEKSSALPLLTNIVAAYTERIRRKTNKIKMEAGDVRNKDYYNDQ